MPGASLKALALDPREALGHEARAEILEGQGGAVEQLQRVGVADRHDRRVEREGRRGHCIDVLV